MNPLAYYSTFNFSTDDYFCLSYCTETPQQKSHHPENGMVSDEPRGINIYKITQMCAATHKFFDSLHIFDE